MRKIYTRTGDEGTTGIHGGTRVPKDDIRIEANGCLDELNALLGIIRSLLPETDEWQHKLYFIQRNLMVVMSHVATPSVLREQNPNELPQDLDKFCEEWMDEMMSQLEDNGYFILPGGTRCLPSCSMPGPWHAGPNDGYGRSTARTLCRRRFSGL